MVCNCTLAGTKACYTCGNNPSGLSKGYYEFKPIDKIQQLSKDIDNHKNHLMEMNEEAIRNRIRYIICCKMNCTEGMLREIVDDIMDLIKKGV